MTGAELRAALKLDKDAVVENARDSDAIAFRNTPAARAKPRQRTPARANAENGGLIHQESDS